MRRVLVANRGEIALRIIRTLRERGLESVAVYSEADKGAPHVQAADRAVCLGPAPAVQSYLSVEAVLKAAKSTGASAIHPGYGFLSENPVFARACEDAGLVFIGPTPESIRQLGDKAEAKRIAARAGVPTVPGVEAHTSASALRKQADTLKLPILLKAAAGGGGKGMRRVNHWNELDSAFESASREAQSAFGDARILAERLVHPARHVEVQVLGDGAGSVIALGERECSLQRRHQKVLEESPSPGITEATRKRMFEAACKLSASVRYRGAGTVEFLATDSGDFFFLEMNTRLQVEHPVTEWCTGLDLVGCQLDVAMGLPLPEEPVPVRGASMQVRLYAEDAERGFLPTSGKLKLLSWPARPFVRVDAALTEGMEVTTYYDPMLAKIIAWAPDREACRIRLRSALAETTVLGLVTNLTFLHDLLDSDPVKKGATYTHSLLEWVEARAPRLPDLHALAALALAFGNTPGRQEAVGAAPGSGDPYSPWKSAGAWRG